MGFLKFIFLILLMIPFAVFIVLLVDKISDFMPKRTLLLREEGQAEQEQSTRKYRESLEKLSGKLRSAAENHIDALDKSMHKDESNHRDRSIRKGESEHRDRSIGKGKSDHREKSKRKGKTRLNAILKRKGVSKRTAESKRGVDSEHKDISDRRSAR